MQVNINRLSDFALDLEQELPKLSRDIMDAATRIERLTFQVAALKTEVTILQKERSKNGTSTNL